MTFLTWSILLVASAVTACASSSRQPATSTTLAAAHLAASPFDTTSPNMEAARAAAGCYSLAVGAWSDERAVVGSVVIPSRIRLDTARHDRRRPGFELIAHVLASAPGRGGERLPAWSPVGADSLQVLAWANGTSSVNLFLRRRAAGTFEGTARYFWDQVFVDPLTKRWLWERYPTAPAILTAASCK